MLSKTPAFIFQAGVRPAIATTLRLACLRSASSTPLSSDNTSSARRKAVTVINDTGRIPWKQLSFGEKAARTTQQSFNVGLAGLGLVLTGGVAYVLWLEVFSPDSKTVIFNKAADRVRKDPKCLEMLAGAGAQSKREISAHGEPSWSRWARNRTVSSRLEKDKAGLEHLHMHFYVEGPVANGTVHLHMTRGPGQSDFEYKTLVLDVPGQQRYYLENEDGLLGQRKSGKLFGVRWN